MSSFPNPEIQLTLGQGFDGVTPAPDKVAVTLGNVFNSCTVKVGQ